MSNHLTKICSICNEHVFRPSGERTQPCFTYIKHRMRICNICSICNVFRPSGERTQPCQVSHGSSGSPSSPSSSSTSSTPCAHPCRWNIATNNYHAPLNLQAPFYPREAAKKGLEVYAFGLVFGTFEVPLVINWLRYIRLFPSDDGVSGQPIHWIGNQ